MFFAKVLKKNMTYHHKSLVSDLST